MKKLAVLCLSSLIGACNLCAIKSEHEKLFDEIEKHVSSIQKIKKFDKETKKTAIREKLLPALDGRGLQI